MIILPNTVNKPSAFTVVFRNPTFGADLTMVSSVAFNVTRRDGTTTTWAGTIVSATPSELVCQYVFQGVGEITSNGLYTLAPTLTVPGGAIPAEGISLFVVPPGTAPPQVEETVWVAATAAIIGLGPLQPITTSGTAQTQIMFVPVAAGKTSLIRVDVFGNQTGGTEGGAASLYLAVLRTGSAAPVNIAGGIREQAWSTGMGVPVVDLLVSGVGMSLVVTPANATQTLWTPRNLKVQEG